MCPPALHRDGCLLWAGPCSGPACKCKVPLSPQIKPVVSQYLKEKRLPYNEDTYGSRLQLFLQKYEELMVHAPPITELVGIQ